MGDVDDVDGRLASLEQSLALESRRLTESLEESARLTTQLRMSADALAGEWKRSRLLREQLAVTHTCSRGGGFHWHAPSNKFECDDRFAQLYGFRARRDMETHHLVNRAHPSDRMLMEATWTRCVTSGIPFFIDLRIPIESGGMRWLAVAGRSHDCEAGASRCVIGACTDTTAAHFGQQMKRLADEIPQLIWIASADGRIEYANERWSEYTGRRICFDDAAALIAVFHRDDRIRIQERWLASVGRGDVFEIEGRIVDAAGRARWFLVQAVPMAGTGGVIERWVGTCTDIDAQKRAQLGAVASLSHELRQPLSSIAAALHAGEWRAPVVERERSTIERQVCRMERIVDEMLDVEGSGQSVIDVQQAPVDVARALAEAVEVCAPAIRERRLTLVCRLSPELAVDGDHDHVVQMLANVLDYGAKALARGRAHLRARVAFEGPRLHRDP